MNGVDVGHKSWKVAGGVGRQVVFYVGRRKSRVEPCQRFAWTLGDAGSVKDVESRGLLKCPSRRSFYFNGAITRDEHSEVDVNEPKETVSFDQDTGRLDACKRKLYSAFDLIVGHDHPVNIGGAGVPVSAGIFIGRISLLKT